LPSQRGKSSRPSSRRLARSSNKPRKRAFSFRRRSPSSAESPPTPASQPTRSETLP
jgi:hypothetical protein